MLALLLVSALLLPHGGQYIPPLPEPQAPDADGPPLPVTQPGLGPTSGFQPERWEWWFEFNHEWLLDLRPRVALASGARWEPVTDEDRLRVLLPAMVDALRGGPRDVRAAATMALGRLGQGAALPFLEAMADDDDLFVRVQATLALGLSAQPGALETLADRLGDRQAPAEIRTFAAAGLGLLGTAEAFDVLAPWLGERRLSRQGNQVRAALVYAAGLSGRPEAVPVLARLLEGRLLQSDSQLRALAGAALGRLGYLEGLAPALRLLGDSHNVVRRSAAAGLLGLAPHLQPPDVARLIEQAQRDSDLPTRFHLLRALGGVRREETRGFLVEQLPRMTTLARPHVALALGLDGSPRLAGALLAVLEDQHERSMRGALVMGLGLLGAPEGAPPLAALLERQRESTLAAYLCLALGLLGRAEPATAERMEELVASTHDPELVRWGVAGLALLGERERIARLADLGQVTGTVDRAARLHALGAVADRTLLAPLLSVATDETQPGFVRAHAWHALGQLADPRPTDPLGRLSRLVEPGHEVGFVAELYRLL